MTKINTEAQVAQVEIRSVHMLCRVVEGEFERCGSGKKMFWQA